MDEHITQVTGDLCKARRTGLTEAANQETFFHLTGNYPAWWKGSRFDVPPRLAKPAEDNDA